MGYIALLKKRELEKERLRGEALKEAERLSALLQREFKYETLYLIGSVVEGKGFTRHSDIDFVVRGLNETLFFKLFAFLLKNNIFNIDLKPWEGLDEVSRIKVEREGRVLS